MQSAKKSRPTTTNRMRSVVVRRDFFAGSNGRQQIFATCKQMRKSSLNANLCEKPRSTQTQAKIFARSKWLREKPLKKDAVRMLTPNFFATCKLLQVCFALCIVMHKMFLWEHWVEKHHSEMCASESFLEEDSCSVITRTKMGWSTMFGHHMFLSESFCKLGGCHRSEQQRFGDSVRPDYPEVGTR